jgi:glycine cleavage system regulatory protein
LKVAGEYAITLVASHETESDRRKLTIGLKKKKIGERFLVFADKLDRYQESGQDGIKYVITIIGDDRVGILEQVTKLFLQRKLNLISVEADIAENVPFHGTPTFKSEFTTRIPHGFQMDSFIAEIEAYGESNDMIHHITRLP